MSTAVSVTQLQKLVDGGQLTAQDIAAKVQSGEIELHDDRSGTQTQTAPESVEAKSKGGVFEGAGNPMVGLKNVGQAYIGGGKGVISTGYHVAKMLGLIKENPDFEKALEGENVPQKIGKGIESAAEFAAGEGAVTAGMKAIPGVAKIAEIPIIGNAIKGAVSGGAVTGAETGSAEEAKKGAIVGGIAPALLEGLGLLAKGVGAKILTARIKPTRADRVDGFKTETITREGLGGMSLDEMLDATKTKIAGLVDKAKTLRGNSKGDVDILQLLGDTESELLADARNVTQLKGIKRVISEYADNLSSFTPTGKMNPADANLIKSAVGKDGAFVAGSVDPDKSARELVANALYPKLRDSIEKNSGPGLGAINKRIQSLIPVERAIYRRLGTAENAEPMGLIRAIALGGGSLGTLALDLLQKSTGAGTALFKGGKFAAAAAPAAAPAVLGARRGASGSY